MSLEAEVAYLQLIDGIRQNQVPPGFSVHSAPRKAARGRDRDVLMVGLYLGASIPNDLSAELPKLLVSAYFGAPGSVTAAMRTTLTAVNTRLFEHNRRLPRSQASGGACCAVLRGGDLYLALAGDGQAIVIHPQAVERFPDPSAAEGPAQALAPLGAARTAEIRYFHTSVAVSDYLLLTASTPAGWETTSLTHLPGAGLESAVARLTRLAGAQASAMIVRFAAPEEKTVTPTKSRPSITAADLRYARKVPPAVLPGAQNIPEPPPPVTPQPPTPSTASIQEPAPQPEAESTSLAGIIARVRASPAMGEAGEPETVVHIGEHTYEFEEAEAEEEPAEPAPAQQSLTERARQTLRSWLAGLPLNRAGKAAQAGSELIGATLSRSGNTFLRRLLPEGALRPNASLRLSQRVLIAIAVLLPIIVAAALGAVYIQRGRNEEYNRYMQQAKNEAGRAEVTSDPFAAKPYWQAALTYLEQAERIYPDQPDTAALRAKAQSAVDAVDNVRRLTFEPLLPDGFSPGAQVSQVVVNGSEVYALDSARQAVYRAVLTEGGQFAPDRNFQCRPGAVGSVVIRKIIDITWLNTPNIVGQPALMAVDEDGDLMYCKTDGTQPEASTLIAPDTGWKFPRAIEIYADRLYIFDPGANDIWLYDRIGGVFSERPKSYFTGQVLDLSGTAHFTITQGEVFILRADGRLIYCVRNLATLQTNCAASTLYFDSRPGHTSGERLDDVAGASALFYDPPPEPSLYLLDSAANGIYQLSLKLVLQKVYRPAAPLPASMTAVAIGPNKEIFVAAGDNIYWARR